MAVRAYPKDGYETSDITQEERRTGNLPEIVDDLPDLKEYSTVIIGGPIWNAYVSTPLARYLELTDLSEKTVIPFSTSQGSGQSSYLKDFQERVRTAERIGEYKDIQFPANYSSDTFSDEEIDEMLAPWIESNSLVSKSVCELAGGVFAANRKAPLLLADTTLRDAQKSFLKA